MLDVHDNEIVSYEVDFKEKTIILKTISEENEKVKVIFKEVLANFFEEGGRQNIIFDIVTDKIEDFIMENEKMLMEKKNSCWPMCYDNLNELQKSLEEKKYKYFVIESSHGLSGWVLAKEMKIGL